MCEAEHILKAHTVREGPPPFSGTENTPAKAGVSQFQEGAIYIRTNAIVLSTYRKHVPSIRALTTYYYLIAIPRDEHTALALVHAERALSWLKTEKPKNPVVWWRAKEWGESPADFGRK